MTSQVNFDSHVFTLVAVAVQLVNELTPGHRGTRMVQAPTGREGARVVAGALAQGGREPAVTERDGARLAATATQMRVVFEAVERGRIADAAATVNRLLKQTQARPQLDRFPDGRWSLHFHGGDDTLAMGWAAGCASALALAVGSDLAGRLGVCDAAPCDRVYVDESKNGTRRYCSARCQSRVKAAAHRARQS